MNLLYRATRDWDNLENFDDLCYQKSNILIIIKTYDGYIFGGYSKICMENFKSFVDENSFLFSINHKKIYPIIKGKKNNFCSNYLILIYLFDSFVLYDNFLNKNINHIRKETTLKFNG